MCRAITAAPAFLCCPNRPHHPRAGMFRTQGQLRRLYSRSGPCWRLQSSAAATPIMQWSSCAVFHATLCAAVAPRPLPSCPWWPMPCPGGGPRLVPLCCCVCMLWVHILTYCPSSRRSRCVLTGKCMVHRYSATRNPGFLYVASELLKVFGKEGSHRDLLGMSCTCQTHLTSVRIGCSCSQRPGSMTAFGAFAWPLCPFWSSLFSRVCLSV